MWPLNSSFGRNDLADIWRDLREPLYYWDAGDETIQAEAAWEWRWTIRNHAGDHLVEAIRVIHGINT